MRIQHNIAAMNSYRNYGNNVKAVNGNLEKLSSGYKINRAGDDAAGLAISEKMRAQITGLNAAQKNVKDGVSLVKTAEGAMQEVQDMLNRMDYLATQSANGTYDDLVDRANLQKEVTSLKTEIDRIADSANFNGIKLLDGTQSGVGGIKFTQGKADNTTQAKVEFTINATGKDLIGGNIQLGTMSVNVKRTDLEHATEGYDDGVIYVTEKTSASTIATAISDAVTDKSYADSVFFSDLDGKVHDNNVAIAASGSKITITAGDNGQIDVTGIPSLSINGGLRLQIGDTSQSFNQMRVGINDVHVSSLFMQTDIDISSQEGATTAVNYIKNAINMVSSTRGDLGAIQNRLEHTQNNLSVMTENIQDAESTIRDTDVAEEMMSYTKNNILIQSAQAMLAQANQIPQGVLQLLG